MGPGTHRLHPPHLLRQRARPHRRNLSPEEKHIYLIERGKGNWVIQTGIDGFRSIAARTDEYAGSDAPVYMYKADNALLSATVTVWRFVQGQRCAYTSSALWDEYNAGQNLWLKMPHVMLAKCAEAQALRKGFPAELAGIYESSEMDQAEPLRADPTTGEIIDAQTHTHTPRPGELASPAQLGKLHVMFKQQEWTDEQIHFHILVQYNARSRKDLTKRQASDLIEYLNQPESPAEDHDIAVEFLSDCNAVQAAQSLDELVAIWKVVYRTWESDQLLVGVVTRIKDARKAELSAA